ncbi:hypothetical protein M1O29_02005 [Dehalococcoidia bacterium]|nr:hypothetical protein [Dehalococcoidia bacterium]
MSPVLNFPFRPSHETPLVIGTIKSLLESIHEPTLKATPDHRNGVNTIVRARHDDFYGTRPWLC